MSHVFEPAPTGRAKCRGCGQAIDKGVLRFGEHVPNQYGEGEATLWFHPRCAAFKRPEAFLETLSPAIDDHAELERIAKASALHKRVPRVDGAERASSGQAACRPCREKIEKGAWRIRLSIYDEGRFAAAGFLHMGCRPAYFEDHDVLEAVLFFSPKLSDADREELKRAYE